jgi:hypothetical protein
MCMAFLKHVRLCIGGVGKEYSGYARGNSNCATQKMRGRSGDIQVQSECKPLV